MAEMFRSRDIPVTFLVRERNFWDAVLPTEEAKLINRHILEHHIDLRLETELREILADETGSVRGVVTKAGEEIACQFVGLTVGVRPNIDFLKSNNEQLSKQGQPTLELNRGILVSGFFETNIADVYAIGDCAEFRESLAPDRKNIEQVWYTGRMHGETLAHNLTSSTPASYKPGVWFNSAKFLDIEYQTYGHVPPFSLEGSDSIYWEDPNGKVAIRLVYEKESKKLLGANALGWRLRHAFFDTAIAEGWTMEAVLSNLHKANFNPEFFDSPTKAVIAVYSQKTGVAISRKKTSFFHRIIGSRS
jgi:NAD(P)H-nitrite reductase large subunit